MAGHRNVSPQLSAGGNITPASFVIPSTAADNTGLLCGANGRAIGISQEGTHQAPGLTGSDAYAAHAGESFMIFGFGDVCNLVAGSAGFVHGDPIKSDGSGLGVTATVVGTDVVCAYALESATSGLSGRVQICSPSKL